MRFCTKCGGELDDAAAFCASCGQQAAGVQHGQAGAPGAGPVPVAARSGGTRSRSRTPLVLLGLVALVLIAGVAVWRISLDKPMSPAEYEAAVQEEATAITDAIINGESVILRDIAWELYSDETETDPATLQGLRSELAMHVETIRVSAENMKALRPPAEYERVHTRVESLAEFLLEGLPVFDVFQEIDEYTDEDEMDRILEKWLADMEEIAARKGERAAADYEILIEELGIPSDIQVR